MPSSQGRTPAEVRLLPNEDHRKPIPARSMAIIVDPSIAKGQNPGQSLPPPSQPPPSYAESADTQPLVVYTSAHAAVYGPTPISQQQQTVLPYYDPQSAYSVRAAERRARERFVGAVLWVVLIFALIPVLVWVDTRIRSGWSVSNCALLRAEPHQPLQTPSPALLEACCPVLFVVSQRSYLVTNMYRIYGTGDVRLTVR